MFPKKLLRYLLSLVLFITSSFVFYGVFTRSTVGLLFEAFGAPGGGAIGLAYAFITVASSLLGAPFGITVASIFMHL